MAKKAKSPPRTFTMPDGSTVELADDVGRVKIIDGRPMVDLVGLIVRLGLGASPSRNVDFEIFPHLELMPGEERPGAGEVLEGRPVFCWITQADAAILTGLSGRQVANLERKGLPSRGHGPTKRYPLPHLHIWFKGYQQRLRKSRNTRDGVSRLSFEMAEAMHAAQQLQEKIESMEDGSGDRADSPIYSSYFDRHGGMYPDEAA